MNVLDYTLISVILTAIAAVIVSIARGKKGGCGGCPQRDVCRK